MSKYECVNDDFKIMGCVKKLYVYSDAYIYENFPRNKKHLRVCLIMLVLQIIQVVMLEKSIRLIFYVILVF